MNRIRHIAIALAALAGTALIVMAAVTLLLPPLLDKSPIGTKIRRDISAHVDGDFNFERLDFAVFPSPHAVLIGSQLLVPDHFSASVESVELYPDILSSLNGHITIKRIALKRPEVTVWISKSTADAETAHQQFDSSRIVRSLLKTLSRLPIIDHGTVSRGRLTLINGRTATATFGDLDAVLQNVNGSITIEATAASELVKKLSLKAEMQSREVEGSARLDIGGLDLGAVTTILSPESSLMVEDGTADMGLSLGVRRDGSISLDFNCSAPRVRLSEGGRMANLDTLRFAGTAQMGTSRTEITISDFHLGTPAISAVGRATISSADPRIRFDFTGQDIDIASSRSVSMAMAGSSPVVRTVFDILQDGTIPSLTVSGQADAPRGWANLDNLALHASLSNGKVVIPGADLELADVSGQVDLAKGILAGQNVAARWQQSGVHQGKFEIDLTKSPLPINVTTKTEVQAADVPKILKKFITAQTFLEELEKIEDLSGSATGNLSLSGDVDRLGIAASAAALKLSARHPSLPFPLQISDGAISYDNDQLQVKSLSGFLGTSAFAGLSGSIGLGAAKTFSVSSGTLRIVIKDLLPWLSSHQPISRVTEYYGGGETILHLTEIQSSGAFADPSSVYFNLTGELQNLVIKNLPAQPGPLEIASLRFTADPKTFAFSDVQAHLLDGSVNASGKYPDYMANKKEISLSFDGRAGPQFLAWITEIGKLPHWLTLQPLTLRKSHLTFADRAGYEISADLALQEDLALSTELRLNQESLIVDSLKVQDHLSKASLSGRKANAFIDVTFEGSLHDSTLKKITPLPLLKSGSLEGKAKVSLELENPHDFKVIGDLIGKKIAVLTVPEVPLVLRNIAVKGMQEGIDITSAEISWSGSSAMVAGKIRPRAGSWPKFALDIDADTIDTDSMLKIFGSVNQRRHNKKTPKSTFSELKGEANFNAKKFIVHGYSLQPMKADVRFLEGSAQVTLKQAVLCDIPVEGSATLEEQQFSYHAQPKVHAQDVSRILECLFDKQFKADGTLDFIGSFEGHGAVQELVKSTIGQAKISISDGRIYHDIILLNLLKFLNAVQVFTGQVSAENMMEKGVGFERFEAQVRIQNGILRYDRFMLDGEEFKLGGTGEIDILKKRLDFTLLVAPLKTSSTVFEHIPLIGGILETLDTIPLGVKGSFDDLHFLPLAPSAVEDEMQDVIKETFGIPMRLVHLDVFRKKTNKGGN